ncbi:MAG TPA: hypothetical protein VN961_12770, partial [Streptosporangiaceae bacterium]|nr:hypothetical protein [Streptosporangiaceae bacterium]
RTLPGGAGRRRRQHEDRPFSRLTSGARAPSRLAPLARLAPGARVNASRPPDAHRRPPGGLA